MNSTDIMHPVILRVAGSERQLSGRAKVAALSRQARIALAQSARFAGLELRVLEKDAQGAPLPCGGVHWSLSHKSDWVAAVASRTPVGIDLERRRPVSEALYARLAEAYEWELAHKRDEALFLRYWTAKEAVLKAVGKGLAGLAHCHIGAIVDQHHVKVIYDGTEWTVAHCSVDATHLAAVTVGAQSVDWHLPGMEDS